jgi:2-alkyl-3-oxoalkanoate reductase
MKVFVAGARGVVGRRLLPVLLESGHEVVALSRSAAGARELEDGGVRAVVGDVLDRARALELLSAERPEAVVFQISGLPQELTSGRAQPPSAQSVLVRTVGARNVAEAARAAGARRLVVQSYAHIYAPREGWVKQESDPLNVGPHVPDGRRRNVEALLALERAACETPGLEGVALRYGSLYGPSTAYDWAGSVAELVRRRRYPVAGGGTGWTSFVHVDDAAQAALHALDAPAGHFNIADDEPAPLRVWLPAYAAAICAPPPRRMTALAARLRFGERFVYRATEQRAADNRWARAQLGFVPRFRTWRDGFRAEFELELEAVA